MTYKCVNVKSKHMCTSRASGIVFAYATTWSRCRQGTVNRDDKAVAGRDTLRAPLLRDARGWGDAQGQGNRCKEFFFSRCAAGNLARNRMPCSGPRLPWHIWMIDNTQSRGYGSDSVFVSVPMGMWFQRIIIDPQHSVALRRCAVPLSHVDLAYLIPVARWRRLCFVAAGCVRALRPCEAEGLHRLL